MIFKDTFAEQKKQKYSLFSDIIYDQVPNIKIG